ncbi:MAG: S41 family peptidase [Sphingobacteriaceae bacterium]
MNLRYTSKSIFQVLIFSFTITSFIFSSCKKKSDSDVYEAQNEVRDSAYLYSQEIYLWPEKLPAISVFQPRNLTDVYEVMDKVRSYQPLDKWSFAETKEETEQSQKGQSEDFGFMVKFGASSFTEIRVTYVYANSTAGLAGVKRGWKVNKINGRTINRNISSDIDYINDIFFGSPLSATFEFMKPDGALVNIPLQKTEYTLNTVLFSNVYVRGNKRIGYFVFNEFSGSTSVTELVNTINSFQNQGVNEMIVDLRYNRGGLVRTQDTLANMLAPLNVGWRQKIMYTYKFNNKYSFMNESYKFHKVGTLNLSRIIFIVSPSSASASELLINNLRPVMDVKLVGDTRTYGKPVGFFPIAVFQYNIFPVSFKTVNSRGEADFFSGFPVDQNVADDLIRDFGDENEANLKAALAYYETGSFKAIAPGKISAVSSGEIQKINSLNAEFADHLPSAAIEDRPSRMPKFIRDLQQ